MLLRRCCRVHVLLHPFSARRHAIVQAHLVLKYVLFVRLHDTMCGGIPACVRYRAREAELQAVIAQSSEAREAEREMQARKFAAQMEKKDEQVRLFRLELDSILDVIRALRSGASLQNTAGIIRSDSLSERLDEFAQR